MSIETTNVEISDLDIEDLLNPGAGSVMLPTTEENKPNLFSRKKEDVDFLNKPFVQDPPPAVVEELDADGKPIVKVPVTPAEVDNIINDDAEDTSKNQGRPKVDKAGLVELANKLIAKNLLVPFDDGKPIDKYTLQDFEELFEANSNERDRKVREEVPGEFFQSLPQELQYAAKYVADGGTDLKGLFKTLASVEEVRNLDPKNPVDQRNIIRSYLQVTQFGTSDEIEEEINGWDDRQELEAKANKFKPKLDALSEKQVQYQLHQQEQLRNRQAEQSQGYMDIVYKTLEPGTLNDLPLDKKTQNMLFAGLVQPNYQSVSGKQTNLLGHLLEKYQFVEPNPSLVAEALWLLADPTGYKEKVRTSTKKDVVAETVRKLKTEESRKIQSHVEEESPERSQVKGIPRPSQNFFKR